MSEDDQTADVCSPSVIRKNREACLERVQSLYVGKHVAWSMDGNTILASGCDMEAVCRELDRLGIATDRVVFDYIDDPDVANF